MNKIFLMMFGLLMVLLFLSSLKRWELHSKGMVWLFLAVYAGALSLFILIVLGFKPPMPTIFFVETLSPWVYSILHPQS